MKGGYTSKPRLAPSGSVPAPHIYSHDIHSNDQNHPQKNNHILFKHDLV